jgi:DNA-binding YbaB/EbfC family protein
MDMMKMMEQVRNMQSKLQEAQENLVNVTADGESGGGMVKATVNGKKHLVSLTVDPELIKPDEQEFMQDLIVAAVNKALTTVDEQIKDEMTKSTAGMMPNIPGLDLSNLK